jgi:hypothetical protein
MSGTLGKNRRDINMKHFILIIILIFIFFYGCNIFNPDTNESGEIETEYIISDTTGVISTVFHSGESFDMKFTLINNTGEDQVFYHSGPTVIFEIIQADSVLTSSIKGLYWPAVMLKGIFKKGKEITDYWRAPNSPLDSQFGTKTILEAGQYKARVRISMGFKYYNAIPSEVKEITITE